MADDIADRVREAFRSLAPAPGSEADLVAALADARREPAGRSWPMVVASLAAVAIVVVGYVALGRTGGSGETGRRSRSAVAPSDGRTVRVHVDAAGNASIEGLPGPALPLVGEPRAIAASLATLLDDLEALAKAAPRERSGSSTLALEVVVADKTSDWRWVQWILQAAADPRVRVRDVRFVSGAPGEVPLAQPLPRDEGPGASGTAPVSLSVQLFAGTFVGRPPAWVPGGVTVRWHGGSGDWPVQTWVVDLPESPVPSGTEGALSLGEAMEALRGAIRRARESLGKAAGVEVVGEIDVPPTARAREGPLSGVPYGVVRAVLGAFRGAGVEDVRFVGSTPPR